MGGGDAKQALATESPSDDPGARRVPRQIKCSRGAPPGAGMGFGFVDDTAFGGDGRCRSLVSMAQTHNLKALCPPFFYIYINRSPEEATTVSQSAYHWQQIAERRILNILRVHRLCSERQLESKISEAGPYNQRAQPHAIFRALKSLQTPYRNLVKPVPVPPQEQGRAPTKFYAPADFDLGRDTDRARYDFVSRYYHLYRQLSSVEKYCGSYLEFLVHQALLRASPSVIVIGRPGENVPSTVVQGIEFFKGKTLPLDHIALVVCQTSIDG